MQLQVSWKKGLPQVCCIVVRLSNNTFAQALYLIVTLIDELFVVCSPIVRLTALPQSTSVATGETSTTSPSLQEIHSRAFRSARRALDHALYNNTSTSDEDSESITHSLLPMIAPEADSAHVTGFHHAGGMSRYNVRREGIVFSDDQCSCNRKSENTNDQNDTSDSERGKSCLSDLSGMFWSLHGIADRVLLAIETQMELSDSLVEESNYDGYKEQAVGWFQRHLGPTQTASQWHMKRFVVEEEDENVDQSKTMNNVADALRTETGERITLPMHTDPSLISVVIHDSYENGVAIENNDVVAKEAPGALGLQYFHPKEKEWKEPEAHGHLVATVFVGSVLAHLTCGKYPAAKHRVVERREREGIEWPLPKRMAATLFVRPQPSALLRVPLPSPWLLQQIKEEEEEPENNSGGQSKKKKSLTKPPVTFDAWLKRVAKNYEKQKKRQKKKNKIES